MSPPARKLRPKQALTEGRRRSPTREYRARSPEGGSVAARPRVESARFASGDLLHRVGNTVGLARLHRREQVQERATYGAGMPLFSMPSFAASGGTSTNFTGFPIAEESF